MARKPQKRDNHVDELEERVVHINRVAKVVKGGRRFGLTALVVIGDHNGKVGIGMGKSQEVPIAVNKAIAEAKKNMFRVSLTPEKTVPHEIMGKYSAGRVLIKPATPGTGVIAGSAARAVMELAGVTDVFAKSLGTDNIMNVVKATADGLKRIQSPAEVSRRRGVSISKIFGQKPKENNADAAKSGNNNKESKVGTKSSISAKKDKKPVSKTAENKPAEKKAPAKKAEPKKAAPKKAVDKKEEADK